MSYNIIATPKFRRAFKKMAKKYSSMKSDFSAFAKDLEEEPIQGVSLGKNCIKFG